MSHIIFSLTKSNNCATGLKIMACNYVFAWVEITSWFFKLSREVFGHWIEFAKRMEGSESKCKLVCIQCPPFCSWEEKICKIQNIRDQTFNLSVTSVDAVRTHGCTYSSSGVCSSKFFIYKQYQELMGSWEPLPRSGEVAGDSISNTASVLPSCSPEIHILITFSASLLKALLQHVKHFTCKIFVDGVSVMGPGSSTEIRDICFSSLASAKLQALKNWTHSSQDWLLE